MKGIVQHFLLLMITLLSQSSCQPTSNQQNQLPLRTIGAIERLSPELDEVLPADAQIEVLAEGYSWSEGPVWVSADSCLLFSDVPQNVIYRWRAGSGIETYLKPSGFTGDQTQSSEPGSNGLALDSEGRLVLCQHGDRRVARMAAPLGQPSAVFETLAEKWQGKRLNSPNDLVLDRRGNIYFTDPPYGLPGQEKSALREIPFHGVFRLDTAGVLSLLLDSLSRPNGIALSMDEKTLFVANSDPARAIWMAYDLSEQGMLSNGRVFYDATDKVGATFNGLPDGLKADENGRLFATGPGGVWIFNDQGQALGRVMPGVPTANCAIGDDGQYLYLTASQYLCRVRLK
jgi:gluconolactonase